MKRYTFELIITEGNSEFWEELTANGNTGCDVIIKDVENALAEYGLETEVKLVKFEDK
jgi:hypothetical protein